MRIRPYIEDKDYEYIEKWIDNEKTHALWCANLMPFPMTRRNLHDLLEKSAIEWTGSAYVATEDNGEIIGFFCYSINVDSNTGFLNFIIVDKEKRGKGYGQKMLRQKTVIGKSDLLKMTLQGMYLRTKVNCGADVT